MVESDFRTSIESGFGIQWFQCVHVLTNERKAEQVRAKFGNWRVFDALNAKTKVKDYVKVRETMFQPCLYPPACLGAASDKEDVRERYWAPIEIYLKMDAN